MELSGSTTLVHMLKSQLKLSCFGSIFQFDVHARNSEIETVEKKNVIRWGPFLLCQCLFHHTGQNSASFTISRRRLFGSCAPSWLSQSDRAQRDTLFPVQIKRLRLESLIVILIWTLNLRQISSANLLCFPSQGALLSDLQRVRDWLIPFLQLKHYFHWKMKRIPLKKRHEPGSEIRNCYKYQNYKHKKTKQTRTWIWGKNGCLCLTSEVGGHHLYICSPPFLCGVEWSGL